MKNTTNLLYSYAHILFLKLLQILHANVWIVGPTIHFELSASLQSLLMTSYHCAPPDIFFYFSNNRQELFQGINKSISDILGQWSENIRMIQFMLYFCIQASPKCWIILQMKWYLQKWANIFFPHILLLTSIIC